MFEDESKNEAISIGYTLLEFLASILVIYFVSVTFGAYLIEDFKETIIFSVLMSSVCFMPILITTKHKNPLNLLERVLIHHEFHTKLEKYLTNLCFGAVIGAWFGALVIPLDWDRWWQKWPVSCLMGASVGCALGPLLCFIKSHNKVKHDL